MHMQQKRIKDFALYPIWDMSVYSGGKYMKSIYKVSLPVVAAAFALAAFSAIAQPSAAVKGDNAQLKADKSKIGRAHV